MGALESIRSVVMGEQRALSAAIAEARSQGLEVRNPMAATKNVSPYQSMEKTMVREWDADQAVRLAYYSNVFVYRCVQQCAMAIAGLPFRAGANPDKPDIFDVKAPLAIKLGPPPGGPAPRVSPRRLWAWTVAQYLITGVVGWELECVQPKGQGDIVNVWPLVSAALNAVPDFSTSPEYFSGYVYGKPGVSDKQLIDLAKEQVFYMWRPSAHDYRQPESPLQAARLGVSVAVMQDRYDYAFLRNDARPAAVVVHEAFGVQAEEDAFKRAFRGDFRGPDNAGKTMFVQATGNDTNGVIGSLDIKVLGLSQRDAQFIARYQQKVNEICVAFGTPMSILGDATRRTYDTANVDHRNWWEGTLQPLCFELSDEINMQIAPRMGNELGWFDFSKVKALQSDSRLLALGATLPLLVGPGKPISNAELRGELGLTDVRPPDLPSDPPPLAPVTPAPAALPVGGAGAGAAPSDSPAPPAGSVPPSAGGGRRAGRLETRSEQRTQEVRRAEYRAIDHTVRNLEPIFQAAVSKVFAKQERAVMSRLGGKRGRRLEQREQGADDLFDQEYWNQEMSAAVEAQYAGVTAAGIQAVAARGISVTYKDEDGVDHVFKVTDPRAQEFIQQRANQLAGQVNDTTYGQIKDALAQGAADGKSIPDIADLIQGVFDSTDSRAETIARTETISAYNGSQSMLGDALPNDVVNGQEWLATDDERTREAHSMADGQQVGSGETFSVDGEDLEYPGDPSGDPENTINCRCTVVLLTPDQWDGGGDSGSTGDTPAEGDSSGDDRSGELEVRTVEQVRDSMLYAGGLEVLG